MIDISLQIWGGLFYLLKKVFFSQAERSKTVDDRKIWRIRSWIVYLTGLPAWVVVFISEHNWIAAGVESGGAPAMLIGLIIAWRGHGAEPKWLDSIAKLSVLVGLVLSVYEFGGIKNLSQFLDYRFPNKQSCRMEIMPIENLWLVIQIAFGYHNILGSGKVMIAAIVTDEIFDIV